MSNYRAKLERDKAKGQQEADAWNAAHPIGTRVIAYPLTRPEDNTPSFFERLDTVTRTPAWILGHGEPVVSVEGYAGGICLSHVDVAPVCEPTTVVTGDMYCLEYECDHDGKDGEERKDDAYCSEVREETICETHSAYEEAESGWEEITYAEPWPCRHAAKQAVS